MAALPEPVTGSGNRIKAALWFAEHGFGVFSVWSTHPDGRCRCPAGQTCGVPGKHPITVNGFQDATTDAARIRTFLAAASRPNYGLVCPEGVFAWDVDGEGWQDRLSALEAQHGPLPPTLRTDTANGQHVFLRWPGSHPRPLHKMFGWVTRWGSGKMAGYVIGPRSVHASGKEYTPAGVFAIADLPDAWARAALAGEPSGTITVGGRPEPESVLPGSRHDALRNTARHYAGTVRDPEALFAAVWAYNERMPQPKTREEVQRAIGDALIKYPADPVEVTEDGDVRPVRTGDESRGILGPPDAARFPAPPDRLAFGGLIGELVADLATGTDASEAGLLGSLLAFMGALYPATGHFGRGQTTAVYVGLVGPSTEGRKGTAMDRAHTALSDVLGHSVLSQVMLDGVNSGEGLVSALEAKQTRYRGEPTAGVMFEEEFATMLAAQGRENSTLDTRMRAAWDGKVLSNRRQVGAQSVEPPYWASALVSITPNELRDKAPKGATTSGSFNRWLWLPVIKRPVEVLDAPPDVPMSLRVPLVEAYHSAQQDRPFIRHTADAQRLLSDYSGHLLRVTSGLERDLSARLVPIALRVAMIHAMAEGQREVTRDHVARGIALADYARSGIGWIFGFMVGDDVTTLLLRTLLEEGVMTKHQITQDITRDPVKRQRAIDELERYGYAERVQVPTAGRPRLEVRLVTSRGLFTPFVQNVPISTFPTEAPAKSHESHETQISHGMHERGQKGEEALGWLTPCRDYEQHQNQHRQTAAGWLCDACEEESPSGICPTCGVGPFLSVEFFDRHQTQAHGR
jgi:hypothetical protein